MSLEPPVGPRTAQDVAVTELRAAIMRGDLPPGAVVRQDAAAREFGLSVIPVREALKTLTAEGLVSHRPRQGYVVTELGPADLDAIHRVRELLEAEAERVGVPRLDAPILTAMSVSMRTQQAAARIGDAVGVVASNRTFHFLLFDLCGNPLLHRYIRQIWDTLDPPHAAYYRRTLIAGDTSRPDHVRGEHRAIAVALAARDHEKALDLLAEHRRTGHESLKASVRFRQSLSQFHLLQ